MSAVSAAIQASQQCCHASYASGAPRRKITDPGPQPNDMIARDHGTQACRSCTYTQLNCQSCHVRHGPPCCTQGSQ